MFVQIIEGRTTDGKALMERGESWQQELRPGAKGYLGVTAGVTADGRAVTIARFESEDAARANSERPEQGAWWAETAKLYDGEPTFTESSDVTLWMGGGSNDAGFVQVMKTTGADRAKLEEMDKAFEPYTSARPDLLGGLRIWTGKDSCIDVAYFTSEAEAREGEKAEMPPEVQELMAGMQEGMGQVEYFDLTEPQVR
jgi:hypothetical protein